MSLSFPLQGKRITVMGTKVPADYCDGLAAEGGRITTTHVQDVLSEQVKRGIVDVILIASFPGRVKQNPAEIASKIRDLSAPDANGLSPHIRTVPIIAMCDNIIGPGPKRDSEIRDLHWIRINPSPELLVRMVVDVLKAPSMSAAEAKEAQLVTHKGSMSNNFGSKPPRRPYTSRAMAPAV